MLTGRQIEQLQDALIDAFASHDALRMLARIELEQNLDAIAGGENLRVLVFNLISWAEQAGAVAQLIDGACRQNSGKRTGADVAAPWDGDRVVGERGQSAVSMNRLWCGRLGHYGGDVEGAGFGAPLCALAGRAKSHDAGTAI